MADLLSATTGLFHRYHGPEFISHEFTNWARKHDIRIEHIQPSKPQQNAYIERHNRTIRYSWVSKHLFETLEDVQYYATHAVALVLQS